MIVSAMLLIYILFITCQSIKENAAVGIVLVAHTRLRALRKTEMLRCRLLG